MDNVYMESTQEDIVIVATKETKTSPTNISETFRKNVNLSSEMHFDYYEDEGDKKNIEAFRSLLENIDKDPESLLYLPIVPLPDDIKSDFSQKEIQEDEELRAVVNKDDYNNKDFEQWFINHNFDPSLIYSKVNVNDITRVASLDYNLQFRIENYGHDDDFNDTKVSLKKVLEVIRVQSIGEYYADSIKDKSLESISKITPDLMPTKPVEIVFDPYSSARGRYVGMLHGVHYISVQTSLVQNPYLSPESNNYFYLQKDESVISHELIHAKQSEVYGNIADFGFKTKIDDIVINNDNANKKEIVNKIDDALYESGNYDETKNQKLTLSILEGEAILAQLFICREKQSREINPQIKNALTDLDKILVNRFRRLDDNGNKYDSCYAERLGIYRKGYDIIHPLQKEFGLRNMQSILSNMDCRAVLDISEGSDKEKAILADPRLLPGLEKNPYITQSLKQNPPKQPVSA